MTNKLLRILLVDDEPSLLKISRHYLSTLENVVILGECGSVAEAKILIKATKPDLLLLDVELQDGTGFDILKHFEGFDFKVIFITAYEHFAINAIKAGAIDFILKPVDETELLEAVKKVAGAAAVSNIQINTTAGYIDGKPKRLIVRTTETMYVINFEELVYCRSDKGYTTFYLTDKSEILVSKPLKDYEEMLPDSIFLRTHQSYIVNVNFIQQLKKDSLIVLKNKAEVPVSVRKKEEIVERLRDMRK